MDNGPSASLGLLRKLAAAYGVQTSYSGSEHKKKVASTESLLAVLRALGAGVATLDDVPAAYSAWQRAEARRIVEPVLVAWDGQLKSIPVRIRRNSIGSQVTLSLKQEDGNLTEWKCCPADTGTVRKFDGDDNYVEIALPFGRHLSPGYHRLTITAGVRHAEALIISAPVKAYSTDEDGRDWGVFIPLYSLHSAPGWGSGNFTDMEELARWVGEAGANTLATLPLLAAFLDSPCEPSPYLPVSKLLWNEFYLDVTRVPDLAVCESARSLVNSRAFQQDIEVLRKSRLVDYRRGMALNKEVLEELSKHFFSAESSRRSMFELFLEEHPEVTDYARFRAAMEKQKKSWRKWPGRLREGTLDADDYDESAAQYHRYVQWLADEQIRNLVESASDCGVGLYLDLPLGTHPDGFDSWRYRDLFVDDVSVGAPPDTVFTRGQDWTFAPLHPQKIREAGYSYTIGCLRHHMRYAQTLRIDHIMGLHRLFFIPRGMQSGEGVYVRYYPQEMYAILSLESHRNKCVIVGEDLGIVPQVVRSAMKTHNFRRMWVMHYELAGHSHRLLPDPLSDQVSSLNTHDMPPFASFWRGQDINDRLKTGIVTFSTARHEKASHAVLKRRLVTFLGNRGLLAGRVTARSVLEACLSYLAASRAPLVLVNLEDLWLETHTQNIPSTTTEHPNWRYKARHDFTSFCQMPQVMAILEILQALRSERESKGVSNRETRETS